jgi:hypothetical protein
MCVAVCLGIWHCQQGVNAWRERRDILGYLKKCLSRVPWGLSLGHLYICLCAGHEGRVRKRWYNAGKAMKLEIYWVLVYNDGLRGATR